MRRIDPVNGANGANGTNGGGNAGGLKRSRSFLVYLEGPADRGILRAWAYRLLPFLGRQLSAASVILGGRQPARAVEHFRARADDVPELRGLCLLDRDDGHDDGALHAEPGLEFFTWSRRHIESYLLVPEAIRRALGREDEDGRIERLLRQHLPDEADERAWANVDAKRLLGPSGVLSRALGKPLALQSVARATREAELHADVHDLFARLREGLERDER